MSFKTKNIILICSFCLLLYLSWNLAIRETLLLSNKIQKIERELTKVESAPEEIQKIESQLLAIKDNTQRLYSSTLEMRQALLSEVSELTKKHKVALRDFPDYFLQNKDGIELTTSPIILSGDFKNLLTMMDDFEKGNAAGKISSASFNIIESPRSKKRTLYLTLYVQSINL